MEVAEVFESMDMSEVTAAENCCQLLLLLLSMSVNPD